MYGKVYWKNIILFCIIAIGLGFFYSLPTNAEEKTVTITPSNYKSGKTIRDALKLQEGDSSRYERLTIQLEPGEYNIKESLCIYGNTTIEATGATIRFVRVVSDKPGYRAPLLYNDASGKVGYEGAGNISINGGIWDFQGDSGQVNYGCSIEAFRFMHASNLSFTNLTMQNLYLSHYLTLEGVDSATVSNCTFKDSKDRAVKKEAIHIDVVHNSDMAPSTQDGVIYDDSACKNIKIDGCTFQNLSRAIGSHIAVAGIFPSDITITNNTFTDIAYEAIKAYHYKNVTIQNNTIVRAGCGIKVYTYADPANADDSSDDDEGSVNYLRANEGTATEPIPENINVTIQNNMIQDIMSDQNGFAIQINGCDGRVMSGVNVIGNHVATTSENCSTRLSSIYVNYSNNINVQDNDMNHPGSMGIVVMNSSNATVHKNVISRAGKNGISSKDNNTVVIYKNIVYGSALHGIYADNTKQLKVTSNTVKADHKTGIYISEQCDGGLVWGNAIKSTASNGIGVGASGFVVIKKNQIQKTAGTGIRADSANSVTIQQNTVTSPGASGISLSNMDTAQVKKNTILKSVKTGIYVNNAQSVKLSENILSDGKMQGISLLQSVSVVLSKNEITNAKKQAVYLSDTSSCGISQNVLSKCKMQGIYVVRGEKNKIAENMIESPGKQGIFVTDSSKANIKKNTIRKDNEGAIFISTGCDNSQIIENTCESSSKNALIATHSKNIKILKNNVKNAGNLGIYALDADKITIKDNTINKTENTGIICQESKGGKAKGNTVESAGKDGILFYKTKQCFASDNQILNCNSGYGLYYSKDSKNRKPTVRLVSVRMNKKKKMVSGYCSPKVTVKVKIKGKVKKSVTLKKTSGFVFRVGKRKAGDEITLVAKDRYGNMQTQSYIVKATKKKAAKSSKASKKKKAVKSSKTTKKNSRKK